MALLHYRTWANIGEITPPNINLFDWVDKSGNLYVANQQNVTEYDPTGNLTFTYDAGTSAPFDVTTNQYGDVFVTDGQVVVEYQQKVDYAAVTCLAVAGGVAVDRAGDVFVNSGQGLLEFRHGLLDSNCTSTTLPVTFTDAEGMAFDTHGNLIVCDFGAHVVDIIAPPYTKITGTLGSGWRGPFGISIDKTGTQAYVSDPFAKTVSVLAYPGGTTTATLGSANGLNQAYDAVDSKNYVP